MIDSPTNESGMELQPDLDLFNALWAQFLLIPRKEENQDRLRAVIILLKELQDKHKGGTLWSEAVRSQDLYVQFFRRELREGKIDTDTFRCFVPTPRK